MGRDGLVHPGISYVAARLVRHGCANLARSGAAVFAHNRIGQMVGSTIVRAPIGLDLLPHWGY